MRRRNIISFLCPFRWVLPYYTWIDTKPLQVNLMALIPYRSYTKELNCLCESFFAEIVSVRRKNLTRCRALIFLPNCPLIFASLIFSSLFTFILPFHFALILLFTLLSFKSRFIVQLQLFFNLLFFYFILYSPLCFPSFHLLPFPLPFPTVFLFLLYHSYAFLFFVIFILFLFPFNPSLTISFLFNLFLQFYFALVLILIFNCFFIRLFSAVPFSIISFLFALSF